MIRIFKTVVESCKLLLHTKTNIQIIIVLLQQSILMQFIISLSVDNYIIGNLYLRYSHIVDNRPQIKIGVNRVIPFRENSVISAVKKIRIFCM